MHVASYSLDRLNSDVWITLNQYLSVEDVANLARTGHWWHRRRLFETIQHLRYFRQPIPTTFLAVLNLSILSHLDLSRDCVINEVVYEHWLLYMLGMPLETLILPTDRRNQSIIHVDIAKLPTTLIRLDLGITFPSNVNGNAWQWHEVLPNLQALRWPRGRGILDNHFANLKLLNMLHTLDVHGWELTGVFINSLPESLTTLSLEHSYRTIEAFCATLPRSLRHLSCPFRHIEHDVAMLPQGLLTLHYSIDSAVLYTAPDEWFASLPPMLTSLAQKDSPQHGLGRRLQTSRYWYKHLPAKLTSLGPITQITGKHPWCALTYFPSTLTDMYWDSEYVDMHNHYPPGLFTRLRGLKTLRSSSSSISKELIADLYTLTPHLTRLDVGSLYTLRENMNWSSQIQWPPQLTSLGILSHNHGQCLPSSVTKLKLYIPNECVSLSSTAIPVSVTRLHLYGGFCRLNVDVSSFSHVKYLTIHDINALCEDDFKLLPPLLNSLSIHLSPVGETLEPERHMLFCHLPNLESLQITIKRI